MQYALVSSTCKLQAVERNVKQQINLNLNPPRGDSLQFEHFSIMSITNCLAMSHPDF